MLLHFLLFLGIALILLKIAGFIFWVWWTVLLPLAIWACIVGFVYLWVVKQLKSH